MHIHERVARGDRKLQVLDLLRSCSEPVPVSVVTRGVGLRSKVYVRRLLEELESEGYVERVPFQFVVGPGYLWRAL